MDRQPLQWTSALSVGISEVDAQHQQLIRYINDLHQAHESGTDSEALAVILANLVQYTVTHFSHEESLMSCHAYPARAEHEAQHDSMTRRVLDLPRKMREEGDRRVAADLLEYLRKWLRSHILHTDRNLGAFLQEKGLH